jgi:hypothetical protein
MNDRTLMLIFQKLFSLTDYLLYKTPKGFSVYRHSNLYFNSYDININL